MIDTPVMMDWTQEAFVPHARAWLSGHLSGERLHHSVGAYEKAQALAQEFGLPPEEVHRVGVAALLHDAGKLMGPAELMAYCGTHGITLEPADRESPQTIHPFVGAEMVRQELGVADEAILNAIRYHTTGRPGMLLTEKLVFIADKIEENTRNPLLIRQISSHLAFTDITSVDRAVLALLEGTITFVIDRGQLLHPRTVETRNDLLRRMKQQSLKNGQPLAETHSEPSC